MARIGYGAMQLSGPGGRDVPPREHAVAVLRRAVELGVNHLDTAQFYANGLVNDLIREALWPYPDNLVIVTKVGATDDSTGRLRPAQHPVELRAAVDANLAALRVERVDVVNLRRLDAGPGLVAEGADAADFDSQLAELTALKDQGKIGGIGLSNVTLDQLTAALDAGVACVQNAYSVLDRAAEPLLAACSGHQVPWVPFFPLGSAFPGYPKVPGDPVVTEVARRAGVTPSQAGLAWLLGHYPGTLLIPGTTSLEHLEANVAAGQVRLDEQATVQLDAVAAP